MTIRGSRLFMSIIIGILFIGFTITGYADEGNPPASDPTVFRSRENPLALTGPSTLPDALVSVPSNSELITPLVVGGNEVTPENSYPWIASLQYYGVHYCGGTLIDPEWILTAAHCWVDANGATYPITPQDKAVLGEHSLSNSSGREQEIGFSEVHIHPDFNYLTFENDFALLKLDTQATLNEFVNTVSLVSSSSSLVGTSSVITGWGATYYGGEVVDSLREANVSVLADTACSNYGAAFFSGSMLCGGTIDGSKDTCQGDSGGPLVYLDIDTWKQVGVTSWGYECGVANFPGVYARVSAGLSWIYSVLPTYTVTFNANGGTGTMDPQIANVPTALTLNAFTRTGYTFSGWNTAAGGGGDAYADEAVYDFSADVTLYAQWSALPINPPGKPTIFAPIGAITDSTPDYQWGHLSEATGYRLAVKDPSNTVIIWKIYNAEDICSGNLCSVNPGIALADGFYSILVQGTNSAGYGPWAGEDFGINVSAPGTTTIISPTGIITDDNTPTYQWEHLSDAIKYRLAVRDSSNNNVIWRIYNAADICSSTICSVNLEVALADGQYRTLVQGGNTVGYGDWTSKNFIINLGGTPLPGKTTITAPTGTISDNTPTYEWAHLSEATGYRLAVDDVSTGNRVLWKVYNAADLCSGSTCSVTPVIGFKDGDYKVSIQATNFVGRGTWATQTFTIDSGGASPPGITTIYAPIGTITDTTPTYQWEYLSEATRYRLAVTDLETGIKSVWMVLIASDVCSGTLCSIDPGIVLATGNYKIELQATNDIGNGFWAREFFTVE